MFLIHIFLQIVVTLFALASTHADEGAKSLTLDGHEIPVTVEIEGKKLVRNGYAHRKATVFQKKVWLGALYLEKTQNQAEIILKSDSLKLIDLYPLYDISAKDSERGWRQSINDNCEKNCDEFKLVIDKFMASLGNFKVGDHYRYIFSKQGLSCWLNDKKYFESDNLAFARLILSTWIGKEPATPQVKRDLLNRH